MKSTNWRHYINLNGDFEFPRYLFATITELMKQSLDMGTLLSNDPAKLRAFKEQIKLLFKNRWLEIAQALESFDLIAPCGCPQDQFCRICGGSRYILNNALSPDQLREIALVVDSPDPELTQKLRAGLKKALEEVQV